MVTVLGLYVIESRKRRGFKRTSFVKISRIAQNKELANNIQTISNAYSLPEAMYDRYSDAEFDTSHNELRIFEKNNPYGPGHFKNIWVTYSTAAFKNGEKVC